jgi:hypothetical protein
MNNSIFYVYQYLDDTGKPYYIGKGSNDRINESHAPWVELPPKERRQFVKIGMIEQDAFNFELALIKKYGRKIDGGILDNIKLTRWVGQSGWKHTEETKQKISKKNQGKIRSEEHKQNYRKPKTAEHAEKIRQANLGRIDDGRAAKSAEKNRLLKWFNNGEVSKMYIPGQQPRNFNPGRISWKHTKVV